MRRSCDRGPLFSDLDSLSPLPILLDGATGTELAERGFDVDRPGWSASAIVEAPRLLAEIHAEYAAAGAQFVTANTFRTHARSLKPLGWESRAAELTRLAVEIARDAAGSGVWIAGSQAPLEDCYSPELVPPDADLEREHRIHARHLADAGADLILVETMNTIREGRAAAAAARDTGLPVLVSFVCGVDGRLLSGESLAAAAQAMAPLRPAALLVNCVPAAAGVDALRALRAVCGSISVGIYANTGLLQRGCWTPSAAADPAVYAAHAREWFEAGARVVGGCCGTRPAHLAAVRDVRDALSTGKR